MQDNRPPSAAAIKLAEFRQILIWPLTIDHNEVATGDCEIADLVRGEAERLGSKAAPAWQRVADPLFHLRREAGPLPSSPQSRQEPYAELVYFHDFVQRFLYPKPEEHAAGRTLLHLFERSDIASVRISQFTGVANDTFSFEVERCNLYLFPVGVAVLAVEISTAGCSRQPSLAEALYLQDGFRRCYVPYFDGEQDASGGINYEPRDVAASVEWLDAEGKAIRLRDARSEPETDPAYVFAAARDFTVASREPPMFRHWADLLPLRLNRKTAADDTRPRWRHIVDERIPVMTYARIVEEKGEDGPLRPGENLARVERGDLIRLCFADTPGPSGTLPYDEEFLENFEKENCYLRFRSMGTLHMFAGYCYVALTAEGKGCPTYLVNHFRHMYFQMALISHMEMASYLAFSSRVSGTVERASLSGSLRDLKFRNSILHIQEEFLRFVHLFRFTGLSNQLQAKELYDAWRKHLRLHTLYGDVQSELESATQFLFAMEAREHTREAREHTMAAMMLNRIAIGGVILGLALSFLGINLIWDPETLKIILGQDTTPPNWSLWTSIGRGVLALGTTLAAFAALAHIALPRWLGRDGADHVGTARTSPSGSSLSVAGGGEDQHFREINTLLRTVIGVGLALATLGLVANALGYGLNGRALISYGVAAAVASVGWRWCGWKSWIGKLRRPKGAS